MTFVYDGAKKGSDLMRKKCDWIKENTMRAAISVFEWQEQEMKL